MLGFTQRIWDNPLTVNQPEVTTKRWHDLGPEQKQLLLILGMDQEAWDNDLDERPWAELQSTCGESFDRFVVICTSIDTLTTG